MQTRGVRANVFRQDVNVNVDVNNLLDHTVLDHAAFRFAPFVVEVCGAVSDADMPLRFTQLWTTPETSLLRVRAIPMVGPAHHRGRCG